MKAWVKYVNQLDADNNLLEIYRKLREEFQKEGWSEEDLEKPPYYTKKIMDLYSMFGVERNRLGSELKSYFGDIELSEFMDYIEKKMKKINDETPLKKN